MIRSHVTRRVEVRTSTVTVEVGTWKRVHRR